MTTKVIINEAALVDYEPLSIPIMLNDILYYLGINNKSENYEEVLVKYDLTTNEVTAITKVTQGNREIRTILAIESKLHAIVFDTSTIRCELVEISDNGDEKHIAKFEKLDFGVEDDSDLHVAFNYNNWLYDNATDSISGSGAYYDYTYHLISNFDVSFSLKDGKTAVVKDAVSPALRGRRRVLALSVKFAFIGRIASFTLVRLEGFVKSVPWRILQKRITALLRIPYQGVARLF